MDINYQYRCDEAYFKAVIDRQYRQGPWLLRLPVQFSLLGTGCSIISLAILGTADPRTVMLVIAICGVAVVSGVWATKWGLMVKFRSQQSFGADAVTLLREHGVGTGTVEHHSVAAWSTYRHAVRFPDGILLKKRSRSIRWLPDSGITSGSVADAIALVGSKTSFRSIT